MVFEKGGFSKSLFNAKEERDDFRKKTLSIFIHILIILLIITRGYIGSAAASLSASRWTDAGWAKTASSIPSIRWNSSSNTSTNHDFSQKS